MTHRGSTEIMKDKIEAFTPWLDKTFLTVIKTKKWCYASEESEKVYICKIHSELDKPHFTLHIMTINPEFMN